MRFSSFRFHFRFTLTDIVSPLHRRSLLSQPPEENSSRQIVLCLAFFACPYAELTANRKKAKPSTAYSTFLAPNIASV